MQATSTELLPVTATAPWHQELQRRADVSVRTATGSMRRTTRMVLRFSVLLVADVLALTAMRIVLLSTVAIGGNLVPGFVFTTVVGPLAAPGRPASLVFWVAIFAALLVTGAYSRHRGLNIPIRLAGACAIAAAATTVAVATVAGWRAASAYSASVGFGAFLALAAGRAVAEWFMARVWPKERATAYAVLIGPNDEQSADIARAVTGPGGDYRITGRYEISGDSGAIEAGELAKKVGSLIEHSGAHACLVTAALPERQMQTIIETGLAYGCLVLCPPRSVGSMDVRPRLAWHWNQPLLEFAIPVLQPAALLTKRVTDIVGSTIILLLLWPIMLAIAIAIRIDSPGPVIFSQDRAGLAGRKFRMLKFRTMRLGADEQKQNLAHMNRSGDNRLFKIPFDPRVTSFGRLLRRWSLDELPQFWNVLRGDMSLVGPRPFFESDFHLYEDHHFRRLETKPGITGLWQVGGRSDLVNFEDVVFLDRQYIEQWSFWLDISILLRTMPSVMRRHGAY